MKCAKCSVQLTTRRRSIWASDGRWYHKACQPVGTYGLLRNAPESDADATVRVTGLAEEPYTCTVIDLMRDNAHDDEVVTSVHKLWIGEKCQIGGGAAPLVTIERIS